MRVLRIWGARTLAALCVAAAAGPAMAEDLKADAAELDQPNFIWQADGSPTGLPTKLRSEKYGVWVRFYGFLEAGVAFNESRMDSIVTPRFVVQESAAFHGQGQWRIYASHTRFGLDVGGDKIPTLFDTTPSGKIEIDFLGGGSQSRNLIRMRKAYLQLKAEHWLVLIGQDSDLYSPLMPSVNYEMVMWGSGNTGDRRPQIRGEYWMDAGPGSLKIQFGLGLTNAVVTQDAEPPAGNGFPDGETSDYPMLQGRVSYALAMGDDDTMGKLTVGLWFARSWMKTDVVVISSDKRQNAWLLGLDFYLPLMAGESGKERLYIQGEYFNGGNMADYRGGMFLTYDGGGKPVKGQGGWLEAGVALNDWLTVLGGFGVDDPDNEDARSLGAGTFDNNIVIYVGTAMDFKPVKVVFDIAHWQTGRIGTDNSNAFRYHLYLRLYF